MIAESYKKKEFVKNLLAWHAENKRTFSWRQTKNPFHILIAEIMLQKTDAKKVSEIYDRFLAKYPNVQALSEASLDELRREILYLGIHSRAERLRKLAIEVIKIHGGDIPSDRKKLLSLPGVGNYIANAVLCFAFNKDVPLIDANIIRILRRVFSIESSNPRPREDQSLWDASAKLVPKGAAREFNLALLDFAAAVCTVKNPKHEECPVKNICDYFRAIS
jgi:A/G-specific adenine glycosylase